MKRIFLFISVCFFLTISSFGIAQHISASYTIDGQLIGLQDNTLIYLTHSKNRKSDTVSVTRSKGDRFSFKGHVSLEGEAYFILIDTAQAIYKQLKRRYVLLHLENSMITIRGAIKDMSPYGIEVRGSKVHEDLMDYSFENKHRFIDKINELMSERGRIVLSKDSSSENMSKLNSIENEIAVLERERPLFKVYWIRTHLNSLITPWLLLRMKDSLKMVYYPLLSERAKSSFHGGELKKEMMRKETLSIGRKAPELNLPTPDGILLSLHAVASRNKLTIIEFWAYWCAPCRKSFPKLKDLYEKYHAKGLAVYGVSVDPKRKAWLKALEEDKLPWNNVIVQENINAAKELYGVSSIPTSFLLDQSGNILLKWTGGESEELEAHLLRL